ncbi:MAG: electron transfer flavoprotein subunit alpha/FixB family protein [Anaerolineae bacterium]|nr:electron transfer flavoprotein subunit alpha/FixB family protein [Anaerolineae bacterium]
MKRVLAVLVSNGGALGRTEVEALSAARRVAESLEGSLTAALVGPVEEPWREAAFAYGAHRVLEAKNGLLSSYQAHLVATAVEQAYHTAQAEVILFPSSTYGLEVAPLLGYRIGAGVVLDCVDLRGEAQTGHVRLTKPVYGGKANWELLAKQGPIVVAMRSRSVEPLPRDPSRRGEVQALEVNLDGQPQRSQVVERQGEESEAQRLEDAPIIVSGGRGVGGKENFASLQELARELGGTLGASRAACDLGWVPASWQIGQTGKKVAPDLYVAVGISGASQHMVGLAGAKHIVAINKDPKAPIFRQAELGVVEDYRAFVPAFIEALRRQKSEG